MTTKVDLQLQANQRHEVDFVILRKERKIVSSIPHRNVQI